MLRVLALGGSLVSLPSGPNTKFLNKFKKLIIERIEEGDRFIIVVGGGSLARNYLQVAKKINPQLNPEDGDYLGIYSTYLNAFLLKSIFSEWAYDRLVDNPYKKIKTNKALIFSGGYLPGNSSDFVATVLAKSYGVKTIVNLSNIDYVYDRDPKKYPQAKKIKELTWSEFLKISGDRWIPGMNIPFDPLASKFAHDQQQEVIVLNGQNINNLRKYFSGEIFSGTRIFNQ